MPKYVGWTADYAKAAKTPQGRVHLHLISCRAMPSDPHWAVRTQRSILCGTPRCRMVNIKEVKDA